MRYSFDIPDFLEWVVERWAPVGSMACKASYSRSHFSRAFKSAVGESPQVLRIRLRLEAGAHLLATTSWGVGEIAMEVGYQTPEAFTKAFGRAFGMSPKAFRRANLSRLLPAESRIHFHPSGLIARRQGETTMTLSCLLFEHHVDDLRGLIEAAARLSDSQLDAVTTSITDEIPFDPYEGSLRSLLDRLIYTQEVWLAALEGGPMPDPRPPRGIDSLRLRHEASGNRLVRFVAEVEEKGLWSSEFVDALCCPPARFTFGGVLAHIVEFSATRRQKAYSALRELGVEDLGYGDPIVWIAARAHQEV